jgi:hypothetical protein
MTVSYARRPPVYTVTVGLLVSEGPMRTRDTREELGAGALRTHLVDLTFTRARLRELIKSHPAEFPGATRDLDGAYDDVRERIKTEIRESDFIDEGRETDPPRTARIKLSYTAGSPQAAWTVTHALAELMIDSALARQRAALLRERAGAEAALETAEVHSDEPIAGSGRSAADRLRATQALAAAAQLGVRAAEEQQALRVELVDPGQVPAVATKSAVIGDGLVTFALALLAACLLAGAFDPRVIDGGDLTGLGVPMLGRLPVLPGPPAWTPAPPRNAEGTSPRTER